MKSYSSNIFEKMGRRRQAQVIVALIVETQGKWEIEQVRQAGIEQLQKYLEWIDLLQFGGEHLEGFVKSQMPIHGNISLRQFIDFVVPFERFLGVTLGEEAGIVITSQDQPQACVQKYPIVFVLDHLRSTFNVGSIFRTAECLGVEHIHLIGYTPTPEDVKLSKTAMGTESIVPWSHHQRLKDCLSVLKSEERTIIGLETVQGAVSLDTFRVPKSVALFVGNERFGLNAETIEQLDHCLTIPMMGQKNSLNVSNALSIAAFEMVRQWRI